MATEAASAERIVNLRNEGKKRIRALTINEEASMPIYFSSLLAAGIEAGSEADDSVTPFVGSKASKSSGKSGKSGSKNPSESPSSDPSEETVPETSKRLSLWEAMEAELKKAQAHESAKVGLVYNLFSKTLKEDPCTYFGKQNLEFGEGKFLKLAYNQ